MVITSIECFVRIVESYSLYHGLTVARQPLRIRNHQAAIFLSLRGQDK